MNSLSSPVEDLASAVYSACHTDLTDISYETYDYNSIEEFKQARLIQELPRITKTRRPTPYDVEVVAMFPQTWGSTALGFGGIGGAAMTTAYTIVISCGREYAVYFGGRFAFKVNDPTENFFEDIRNKNIDAVSRTEKYVRSE